LKPFEVFLSSIEKITLNSKTPIPVAFNAEILVLEKGDYIYMYQKSLIVSEIEILFMKNK
jgi:hypothetical protein